MISTSSRYASAQVAPVTDTAGVTRLTILPSPPADATYQVQYYSWQQNDRVDTVAARFYNSEQLWWIFARANPEILVWTNLAAGTVIRVPTHA
jgi:hypothetical protein